MIREPDRDELARVRRSACDALAEAERAGLPDEELERLADQVIVSSMLLDQRA
jgi:hypothetical protein